MFPLTTLALLLSSAPVPEEAVLFPLQPVVIAKGRGYFIHAIPGMIPSTRIPLFGTSFGPGMGVYLTDATSGEMRPVVVSGTSATIIPMGIDRIQYERSRIVGIQADAERLYVLEAVWHKRTLRAIGPIPEPGDFPEKPTYRLAVVSLPDGATRQNHYLKEADLPKEPPANDNAKYGPLSLTDGGVTCYGVTFRFKGMELLEHRYQKK